MKPEATSIQATKTIRSNFNFDYYYMPGKHLDDSELQSLTFQLRSIASSCFSEIPFYQALTGDRKELSRCIVIIAKDSNDSPIGFISSLLLDIEGVGEILHLGLTCVSKEGRGKGLTRKLSSKLIIKYLLKNSPFKKIWFSNVACVISSLSNVSLYFEDVYPSTFSSKTSSPVHNKIAQYINEHYRVPLAINKNANFNRENFVFEGSVQNSVFQKDKDDRRYFHRNKELTRFYQETMNFQRGDEVLQIGKVSILTYPIYLLKVFKLKVKNSLT